MYVQKLQEFWTTHNDQYWLCYTLAFQITVHVRLYSDKKNWIYTASFGSVRYQIYVDSISMTAYI